MSQPAYESFRSHYKKIATVSAISSLLSWDQEVVLPEGSAEMRADQLSYIQSHSHALQTDPHYLELLQNLTAQSGALTAKQKREISFHLKKVQRSHKVPAALVEELAQASVYGHEAWKESRKRNDFSIFAPGLKKLLALQKQLGDYTKENGQTSYEALASEYEPEFPLDEMRSIFANLREELVPAAARIIEKQKSQSHSMTFAMPIEEQRRLSKDAAQLMGFDFTIGRIDEAAHPFCSGGWKDVRMTTRYRESDWTDSLYSVLHEGGHGLYEQGIGRALAVEPLAHAPSFGMHESQSRFWENCVGRSPEFARFMVPHMKANFRVDATLTPEIFYTHVNRPTYSYIRVDADEVTYNLHIMLRYELEDALFRGDLNVDDLPAAWNEKVKHYLHLPAPKDTEGVLQDVHWAWGAFGYFPSYTIGNLIAADLLETMQKDLNVFSLIEKGDFLSMKEWLYSKVHTMGAQKTTRDLFKSITGHDLRARNFVNYLEKKFI